MPTKLLDYSLIAPASVAQLDAPSDWRIGRLRVHHSFVENDHKIFSTVVFSLPLIQEGQLLVSGEGMCMCSGTI